MYQFIHVEIYAETVSAKAVDRRNKTNSQGRMNGGTKSLLNVRKVIAEAKREADACPHVESPQQPIKIFGLDLDEVETLAIESKWGHADSMGRKLRSDTPCLLAGITSYPRYEYEINPNKFYEWLNDTVEWLKKHYGDNLKNVTLHLDEENPHIHFYAVSPDGRVKHIHVGYQAESIVDAKDTKARSLAYKDGMRKFQDLYYWDVAAKNGMLRDGPKKRRLSQSAHKAEKAHALMAGEKYKEIELMDQLAAQGIAQMYDEMVEVAKQESEEKTNSMIESAKLQVKKMLVGAQNKVDHMRHEVMQWSKNAIENMRKLADAEMKVQALSSEVKDTRGQLEYFVEENLELKRQLAAATKKV